MIYSLPVVVVCDAQGLTAKRVHEFGASPTIIIMAGDNELAQHAHMRAQTRVVTFITGK